MPKKNPINLLLKGAALLFHETARDVIPLYTLPGLFGQNTGDCSLLLNNKCYKKIIVSCNLHSLFLVEYM